jgi:formamidopyrimidine-DNA glycosylase
VLWTAAGIETHPLLASLGVEPLSRALDAARLHALTRAHRVPIKLFLMDARRVVGVGNIYASESLFRAGIDPRTPARRVSLERCARLSRAIKQTLRAAIRAGGSSLRDFVGTDGVAGYFQQRYWVYDRAGERCRRCGAAIRRILQGQRSTYFCPRCRFSTLGWTNLATSPPSAAISRTSVAEMNMCCSEGVRNTVSMSG